MVVCPHGSEPKAGTPVYFQVDVAQMASFLPAGLSWALPFLAYLPPITFDTVAFCALDPPEIPTIDAFDVASLITGGRIGAALTAAQKFTQLIQAYAWYSLCTCMVDSTPAAPTAPTAPTDLPELNPPLIVSNPPVAACGDYLSGSTLITTDAVHRYYLIPTSTATVPAAAPRPISRPVPAGATNYSATFANTGTGSPAISATIQLVWQNSAFSPLRFDGPPALAKGASATITGTVPTGATNFYVDVGLSSAAGTATTLTAEVQLFCGSLPGQVQSSCCPPDPILTARLNSILEMVTLIQRQAAPFSYINGASHSGLSGQGHIDVQGLIGVSVNLTTTPGRIGSVDGDPDTLFDVGWINLGTGDGSGRRLFVSSDPWVYFPNSAALITRVGYTFQPDVVATITELIREPS